MKKSKILKIILLFVSLQWQINVYAEEIHVSLREAILLALRYNQNVQSSELQRILDKFSVAVAENTFEIHYALTGSMAASETMSNAQPWAKARSYAVTPVLTRKTVYGTQFGFTLNNPLAWTNSENRYIFNPSASFTLSHPLLRGSGTLINEAPLISAYNTEAVSKLNYKSTVMTTITTIIGDYYAVVQAENTLMVDRDALKASKQTVSQNKLRIENGFMAPSENIQAEFAVAQQELQVVTDENAVIQAKLTLLQDMGLSSITKISVDKQINTDNVTYPVGEEAKRILFCKNISYLSALYGIQNTKLGLLQAEDSQRWQLDFTAEWTQGPGSGGGPNAGYKSLFNGRNVSRSIGLALAIPIDDLSSQQSLLSAKVGYDQAKLALKQLRMSLESNLIGSIEALDIAKTQIILAKRSQDLANQSYQDSLKKLTYGKVSLFEVTTLQTNLVTAQVAYINAEINLLNLVAAYQLNLGITLDVWNIQLKY